tara:strand:- start:299 stop:466 length:168 start_codon:yes stop_codon:yes gene_type:complete
MDWDQIIPVISLIAVLVLVLPTFLSTNSKLKQFFKNLSIWTIIIIIVMLLLYIIV